MYQRAANDTTIAIHGNKDIAGCTNEGSNIDLEVHIADVKKTPESVKKMCDVGHRVVFDDDGNLW